MPTLVEVNEGEAGTGTEAGRRPACGTVSIATYSVRDGRGEGEDRQRFLGVCSAARAMKVTGGDVAFVQETKTVDPTFATREFEGYSVLAAADSERRGGVAPLAKERDRFRVENKKAVGPNVILFELITGDDEGGKEWWYVVGCYLPPSDKEGEAQRRVLQALGEQPEGTKPLIIGDLNASLDVPRTTQEEVLAAEMARRGISWVSRHFMTRRRHRRRHRGR